MGLMDKIKRIQEQSAFEREMQGKKPRTLLMIALIGLIEWARQEYKFIIMVLIGIASVVFTIL